jgi:hypothetical protein
MRPEHRNIITTWLHNEGRSYRDVIYFAERELGIKLSLAAVSRFYYQGLQQQSIVELADAHEAAQEIQESPGDIETFRKSAMKMVHLRFLQKSMANADVQEIAVLGRIVAQAEEREIRRERVKLARDKFQFKAVRAALKLVPLAQKFKEEKLKREEEEMEAFARRLFGSEWDKIILPIPGAVKPPLPKLPVENPKPQANKV